MQANNVDFVANDIVVPLYKKSQGQPLTNDVLKSLINVDNLNSKYVWKYNNQSFSIRVNETIRLSIEFSSDGDATLQIEQYPEYNPSLSYFDNPQNERKTTIKTVKGKVVGDFIPLSDNSTNNYTTYGGGGIKLRKTEEKVKLGNLTRVVYKTTKGAKYVKCNKQFVKLSEAKKQAHKKSK